MRTVRAGLTGLLILLWADTVSAQAPRHHPVITEDRGHEEYSPCWWFHRMRDVESRIRDLERQQRLQPQTDPALSAAIRQLTEQQGQILQLLQRQQLPPVVLPPAVGVPLQPLPIAGVPLQPLPIAGVPLQPLPIAGVPLQPLPIAGAPLQQFPISGAPRQQLQIQRQQLELQELLHQQQLDRLQRLPIAAAPAAPPVAAPLQLLPVAPLAPAAPPVAAPPASTMLPEPAGYQRFTHALYRR